LKASLLVFGHIITSRYLLLVSLGQDITSEFFTVKIREDPPWHWHRPRIRHGLIRACFETLPTLLLLRLFPRGECLGARGSALSELSIDRSLVHQLAVTMSEVDGRDTLLFHCVLR